MSNSPRNVLYLTKGAGPIPTVQAGLLVRMVASSPLGSSSARAFSRHVSCHGRSAQVVHPESTSRGHSSSDASAASGRSTRLSKASAADQDEQDAGELHSEQSEFSKLRRVSGNAVCYVCCDDDPKLLPELLVGSICACATLAIHVRPCLEQLVNHSSRATHTIAARLSCSVCLQLYRLPYTTHRSSLASAARQNAHALQPSHASGAPSGAARGAAHGAAQGGAGTVVIVGPAGSDEVAHHFGAEEAAWRPAPSSCQWALISCLSAVLVAMALALAVTNVSFQIACTVLISIGVLVAASLRTLLRKNAAVLAPVTSVRGSRAPAPRARGWRLPRLRLPQLGRRRPRAAGAAAAPDLEAQPQPQPPQRAADALAGLGTAAARPATDGAREAARSAAAPPALLIRFQAPRLERASSSPAFHRTAHGGERERSRHQQHRSPERSASSQSGSQRGRARAGRTHAQPELESAHGSTRPATARGARAAIASRAGECDGSSGSHQPVSLALAAHAAASFQRLDAAEAARLGDRAAGAAGSGSALYPSISSPLFRPGCTAWQSPGSPVRALGGYSSAGSSLRGGGVLFCRRDGGNAAAGGSLGAGSAGAGSAGGPGSAGGSLRGLPIGGF